MRRNPCKNSQFTQFNSNSKNPAKCRVNTRRNPYKNSQFKRFNSTSKSGNSSCQIPVISNSKNLVILRVKICENPGQTLVNSKDKIWAILCVKMRKWSSNCWPIICLQKPEYSTKITWIFWGQNIGTSYGSIQPVNPAILCVKMLWNPRRTKVSSNSKNPVILRAKICENPVQTIVNSKDKIWAILWKAGIFDQNNVNFLSVKLLWNPNKVEFNSSVPKCVKIQAKIAT